MQWDEIRCHFQHQWLVVEVMKAHSENGKRILEDMSIVNTYPDGSAAMKGYSQLHREFPQREFYFVHTDRKTIEIEERFSLGIRGLPCK